MTKCYKLKTIFIVLALSTLAACMQKIVLKKDANIKELNVVLEFDKSISKDIAKSYRKEFDGFIIDFNNSNHNFKINETDVDGLDSTLLIYMASSKLINRTQQSKHAVFTVIGIALPIILISSGSPFIIAYAYLPQNRSEALLIFSKDLDGKGDASIRRKITSSPYFGSLEEQKQKQAKSFRAFLSDLMIEIENINN